MHICLLFFSVDIKATAQVNVESGDYFHDEKKLFLLLLLWDCLISLYFLFLCMVGGEKLIVSYDPLFYLLLCD